MKVFMLLPETGKKRYGLEVLRGLQVNRRLCAIPILDLGTIAKVQCPTLDVESTRFPLHAAALAMREGVRHSLQLKVPA